MVRLPPVIVTNFKRRVTGVSTTAIRVAEAQEVLAPGHLGLCGPKHPLKLWQVLLGGWQRPVGKPFRIWHVRRDAEMMWGLIAKHILRQPLRLVFTSSQKRAHSGFPAWLIRQMDALIATTPATAQARTFQGKRPHLIQGHGVDTRTFVPNAHRLNPAQGLKFAQVGRIREEKGSGLFIAAICQVFPNHPSAQAHIFGRALDPAYEASLKAQLEAARVHHQVLWHGEVPPENLPGALSQCHCLVAVPAYEPYGLTPFEGMAAALDLICTDTGAFDLATHGGQTGALIAPDDLSALCQAMEACLQDPQAVLTRGQENRTRAEAEFSIDREAAAVNSLYQDLWQGTLQEINA